MKLFFKSNAITDRSQWNTNAIEGGALNANYQDVEAAIWMSNRLGSAGYQYQKDFYFIICAAGIVVLEFYNKECAMSAGLMFGSAVTSQY